MLRNRQTKEKILKYCIQPTRLDESVRMLATEIVWISEDAIVHCTLVEAGAKEEEGENGDEEKERLILARYENPSSQFKQKKIFYQGSPHRPQGGRNQLRRRKDPKTPPPASATGGERGRRCQREGGPFVQVQGAEASSSNPVEGQLASRIHDRMRTVGIPSNFI